MKTPMDKRADQLLKELERGLKMKRDADKLNMVLTVIGVLALGTLLLALASVCHAMPANEAHALTVRVIHAQIQAQHEQVTLAINNQIKAATELGKFRLRINLVGVTDSVFAQVVNDLKRDGYAIIVAGESNVISIHW